VNVTVLLIYAGASRVSSSKISRNALTVSCRCMLFALIFKTQFAYFDALVIVLCVLLHDVQLIPLQIFARPAHVSIAHFKYRTDFLQTILNALLIVSRIHESRIFTNLTVIHCNFQFNRLTSNLLCACSRLL
jgi:hypothetical protein